MPAGPMHPKPDASRAPEAVLDARFSQPGAIPTTWSVVDEVLTEAGVYWLTTVRADGRPHVTPLIGVWKDGALRFCTGRTEQKARNLAADPRCVVTTGRNTLDAGLDVVVEGEARRVTDADTLRGLAGGLVSKYGEEWRFAVDDDCLSRDGNIALVYMVAPAKVLAFGKGEFSQTRFRFQ